MKILVTGGTVNAVEAAIRELTRIPIFSAITHKR